MKPGLALWIIGTVVTALPVGAEPPPAIEAEKLIAHLRPAYSRPGSFLPAALRFPLRLDPSADLKAAHAEMELHPDDLEAARRAAQLAEQAEAPSAETIWKAVLSAVEAQLKKKPGDAALLERQVEAMVGADLGVRVVPPAEKLRAAAPQNWRTHLLYGDARLRRADFNWRVCVRLGERVKSAPQFAELLGDLTAADAAYRKAVEMAPGEAAPRGAKISLAMARMVMASLMPKGVIPDAGGLDVPALRGELIELCRRSPGKVEALWHTVHFMATFSTQETPPSVEERSLLAKSLAETRATAPAEQVFLAEAQGMWAVCQQDWTAGRKAFEAARAGQPARRFASEWLALCEARCGEPPAAVIARVRSRIRAHPGTEDYALLGVLLGKDRPAEAEEALRKAIELDVQNANARYNLALRLLRRRPDSTEARHHLRLALETEPDNLEARLTQGVALALSGNTAAAQQQLQGLRALPQTDEDLKQRITAILTAINGRANSGG